MRIEHMALWTGNLEKMKEFYTVFFKGLAGKKYVNPSRGFESYFIEFESGARIELMSMKPADSCSNPCDIQCTGYAHIAFSAGSKAAVDEFTHSLAQAGFQVVSGPRLTGDGYYESCVLDPEGNRIEITV